MMFDLQQLFSIVGSIHQLNFNLNKFEPRSFIYKQEKKKKEKKKEEEEEILHWSVFSQLSHSLVQIHFYLPYLVLIQTNLNENIQAISENEYDFDRRIENLGSE